MAYETPQQPKKTSGYGKGYGKRPMWQWVLIYVIVGGLVYFAIYYFAIAKKGGYNANNANYNYNASGVNYNVNAPANTNTSTNAASGTFPANTNTGTSANVNISVY